MSRKDTLVLASRALALLLAVSALGEASYLPERLYSFLHYTSQEAESSGRDSILASLSSPRAGFSCD